MDTVHALYDAYAALQSQPNAVTAASHFPVLLAAIKGDLKSKTLTAQMIPKFFTIAPDHEVALNAMLDLIEDSEANIRIAAVKGLVTICSNEHVHCSRIIDVFGQLLGEATGAEQKTLKESSHKLVTLDYKGCFSALCTLIRSTADEKVRDKALELIVEAAKLAPSMIHKDLETQKVVAVDIIKLLQMESGITGVEFNALVNVYKNFPAFSKDPQLPAELVSVLSVQANLSKDFDSASEEQLARLTSCFSTLLPLLSSGADPSPFLLYFFNKVLPSLSSISETGRLSLLKSVADASAHVPLATARQLIAPVYDLFKQLIATPTESSKIKLNFCAVECVLFTFHNVSRHTLSSLRNICGIFTPTGQPSDFKGENVEEKKSDCLARLNHMKQQANQYHTQIRSSIEVAKKNVASAPAAEKDTAALKLNALETALLTTANIGSMIQPLVKQPPAFGISGLTFSWRNKKKVVGKGAASAAQQKAQPQASKKPQQQQARPASAAASSSASTAGNVGRKRKQPTAAAATNNNQNQSKVQRFASALGIRGRQRQQVQQNQPRSASANQQQQPLKRRRIARPGNAVSVQGNRTQQQNRVQGNRVQNRVQGNRVQQQNRVQGNRNQQQNRGQGNRTNNSNRQGAATQRAPLRLRQRTVQGARRPRQQLQQQKQPQQQKQQKQQSQQQARKPAASASVSAADFAAYGSAGRARFRPRPRGPKRA